MNPSDSPKLLICTPLLFITMMICFTFTGCTGGSASTPINGGHRRALTAIRRPCRRRAHEGSGRESDCAAWNLKGGSA